MIDGLLAMRRGRRGSKTDTRFEVELDVPVEFQLVLASQARRDVGLRPREHGKYSLADPSTNRITVKFA